MVIGTGLIARAFFHYKNNDEFIIFASGVSNSLSNDQDEFEKEFSLLKRTLSVKQNDQKLIYFSSFNVFDPSLSENNYVIHKKRMESFIKEFPNTLIMRLPIVMANSKNPNTLINFFVNKITQKQPFTIYSKALRYIISIEETVKIIDHILSKKEPAGVYNISFPKPFMVNQMVEMIEKGLSMKGNYQTVDQGTQYNVDDIFYTFNSTETAFDTSSDYFLHHFKKCYLN